MVDRAGAIVERWAYGSYSRPLLRESAGRGAINDTDLDGSGVVKKTWCPKDGPPPP